MGGTDVGDHRHIRFGAAGQPGDLAWPPHAHLDHHRSITRPRSQHGEGDANVVVVVALTGLDGSERCQNRPNQFTGRGFAGGTGHRHQGQPQRPAMPQRQLLIGHQGVIHPPMQQPIGHGACPAHRHHGPLGAQQRELLQETVTIEAFPHKGNKEIASRQTAAVGADRPQCLLWIRHSTIRFPPTINQLLDPQSHAGAGVLNRIMPLPT